MTRSAARGALELGALGVVFGDIGTSPLYTVQTAFSPSDPHRVHVSAQNVYGVTSMIFWSVMAIVTVTYVLLVMRADNQGEGGIMALITLIRRHSAPSKRRVIGPGLLLSWRPSTVRIGASSLSVLTSRLR